MIGRHTAFVDPIELQVFPGNLLPVLCTGVGEHFEGIFRSMAAGDGDARLAPRPGSRTNTIYKVLRRAVGYGFRACVHVVENFCCLSHATRSSQGLKPRLFSSIYGTTK